jgi:hypothetical protein
MSFSKTIKFQSQNESFIYESLVLKIRKIIWKYQKLNFICLISLSIRLNNIGLKVIFVIPKRHKQIN